MSRQFKPRPPRFVYHEANIISRVDISLVINHDLYHARAIMNILTDGFNHFVVIKGIHDDKMLIGDPVLGTRLVPRKEFEGKWLNGLVFVIHNRPDIAKFNVAEHWSLLPTFPLGDVLARESLANVTLSRFGPNDF